MTNSRANVQTTPATSGAAMRNAARAALITGLLISAAGCVKFGAEPPDRLLAIASTATVPAGVSASSASESALFIDVPNVPKALATPRVAVRENSTSFAYVKDAIWVDTPARQFQSLLSETIRSRSNILVLDPGQYLARTGYILNGDLVEFGIDATRREAVVTFDATMLSPDGLTVTRQRFTASAPVSRIDADGVAPAISAAANDVANAVATWVSSRT
ncbi:MULTISPECIES: ABC-type transport auxiliary lipoprotein family protein [unclassified Sphingobium]|uniref:ABC-type transport auxiliary lipoprotein family protein n=1 Tax=unclassified Sphingobium TaxID=2611147 RepID=UPI0022244727|nr:MULTISPECIES: ABC-type transport auxiliary lipoprotein family protein [unclassified Sphingobium]MCW2348850.1 cholesterol transport system auxiliary component [Sphingobium sp. B12D2B]MCW2396266.1 cholesterol transport system auxiliary component [Sphingobium sp. B8D3B]MCW2419782.1 cholesterol transport system auxiliary component [Sphingobium sp. B8D3C]